MSFFYRWRENSFHEDVNVFSFEIGNQGGKKIWKIFQASKEVKLNIGYQILSSRHREAKKCLNIYIEKQINDISHCCHATKLDESISIKYEEEEDTLHNGSISVDFF